MAGRIRWAAGKKCPSPAGLAQFEHAAKVALETALDIALSTMDEEIKSSSFDFLHKALVAVSGAAGGALGIPARSIELPFSTTVMLRSIADITRSEGEPIASVESKLACLEVFALGTLSAGHQPKPGNVSWPKA